MPPSTPNPQPLPTKRPAGPTLTLAGAALIVVGSFLPWATLTTVFGSIGFAGTEGDGKITLAIGLLTGIAAFLELTQGRDTRVPVIVLATAAGLAGIFGVANISDRIAGVNSGFVHASTGIGLYAVIAGAGVALCGALVDQDARPESSRQVRVVLLLTTIGIAAIALVGGHVLGPTQVAATGRLTKTELITQGDAICKTFSDKAGPIGHNITAAPGADNLSQYAAAFGQLETVFGDMIDGLEALNPPEADQGTWDGITGGLENELGALQEAKTAAESGDLTAFNAAGTKIGQLDSETSNLATTYGFHVCGGGSGSGSSGSTGATGASAGATGSSG